MQSLIDFLREQFAHNQFFGGGLILMLGGAVLAACRSIPSQLYRYIIYHSFVSVDVPDNVPVFRWITLWLAQQEYTTKRARNLTADVKYLDYAECRDAPDGDSRPRILLTPAPGLHILWYRGRLMYLERHRPKQDTNTQVSIGSAMFKETYAIAILGRDRGIISQLLNDIRDVAEPKTDSKVMLYRYNYGSWSEYTARPKRELASVILQDDLLQQLITDAQTFLTTRDWYVKRGIPYHRGYLLYGPPGTGKSSAIIAIASALNMNVCVFSLSEVTMSDATLLDALSLFPANAIILIEDIDCAFDGRDNTQADDNRITFSGLLNALDGIAAGDGRLLFATTNHPEKLDAALCRPGRFDRKELIGYASCDQARRMFLHFYGDEYAAEAAQFAAKLHDKQLAPAAIQGHFINYAHEPTQAVANANLLK